MEAPEWAPWKKKNDNPSIPVGEKRKPERQNKYDPVSMKLDEKKTSASSIPQLASIDLSDITPSAGKVKRAPVDNNQISSPQSSTDDAKKDEGVAALPSISKPLAAPKNDNAGYPKLSALPEIPQPIDIQTQNNKISEMQQAGQMAQYDSAALPPLPDSVASMSQAINEPAPFPSMPNMEKKTLEANYPAPSGIPVPMSSTPASHPAPAFANNNIALTAPLPDLSDINSQAPQSFALAPINLVPPANIDAPVASMPKTLSGKKSTTEKQIHQVAIEPMQVAADAGANSFPMQLDGATQSGALKLIPPTTPEYYQAIIIPESRYSSRRLRR